MADVGAEAVGWRGTPILAERTAVAFGGWGGCHPPGRWGYAVAILIAVAGPSLELIRGVRELLVGAGQSGNRDAKLTGYAAAKRRRERISRAPTGSTTTFDRRSHLQ